MPCPVFATGVTIVTAQDGGENPVGMTASSFNSVSTDPPLILWSVTKTALSAKAFHAAKNFAVHVLATDQTELSTRFAKSGADKFGDAEYALDNRGVPLLAGCATRFDCTTWAVYEGGDHWIIVGHVEAIHRAKKEGLVFGGGAYAIAAPLATIGDVAPVKTDDASALDSMFVLSLCPRAYHQMGHQFHNAVRDAGLTLAEWRILANLQGGARLTFGDLAARTFLDPQSLTDNIQSLEEDGFCKIARESGGKTVVGTKAGAKRVEELFDLGNRIEAVALNDAGAEKRDVLFEMLKRVVSNTDDLGQAK